MRVLLVKLSSLGDVIHTLPALTDAMRMLPEVRFDWVVEEGFAEIPQWHPAVVEAIPYGLRRWRRDWLGTRGERRDFRQNIRTRQYDRVIDAQGLIKSAWVSLMADGDRWGFDRASAREPLASFMYQHRVAVSRQQHAVWRTRSLFAAALGYEMPQTPPEYALQRSRLPSTPAYSGDLLFLHGTTWPSKHWPQSYWERLTALAVADGRHVLLPWGNDDERERAQSIARVGGRLAEVLPRSSLGEMASIIAHVGVVIGVDTGLAHLAAALGVPSVTLYGATRPDRTGTCGVDQIHLTAKFPCSPCLARNCSYLGSSEVRPACYESLEPEQIWTLAREQLKRGNIRDANGS